MRQILLLYIELLNRFLLNWIWEFWCGIPYAKILAPSLVAWATKQAPTLLASINQVSVCFLSAGVNACTYSTPNPALPAHAMPMDMEQVLGQRICALHFMPGYQHSPLLCVLACRWFRRFGAHSIIQGHYVDLIAFIYCHWPNLGAFGQSTQERNSSVSNHI
jgi:hypothetical protein